MEKHKDIIESKKNDGKIVEKKKTDMGRNAQGFFLCTLCKCSLCKTIKSPVEKYEIKSKKDVAHDKKKSVEKPEGVHKM